MGTAVQEEARGMTIVAKAAGIQEAHILTSGLDGYYEDLKDDGVVLMSF